MTMFQIDKLTFSSDASPYLQTTTHAEFKTTTLQRSAINMSIGKNLHIPILNSNLSINFDIQCIHHTTSYA